MLPWPSADALIGMSLRPRCSPVNMKASLGYNRRRAIELIRPTEERPIELAVQEDGALPQ